MSNLRKDNYAVAQTEFGLVYGKVLSTKGDAVVLATDGGASARVPSNMVAKISFSEFKANAGKTSATFDAAAAGAVEEPTVSTAEVGVVVEEKTSVVRPGGYRRPGRAGTGKKSIILSLYREMAGSSRKDLVAAFMSVGLSKAGSNTYLQNIRNAVKNPNNPKFASWNPSTKH